MASCPQPTSGTTAPASAATSHPNPAEVFARFFELWLQEQQHDLQSLRAAASSKNQDHILQPLVDRVLGHYENYYCYKSASAKRDVLPMFSPSWISSVEHLFLWVGGYRPTVAFHLLYSKSGLQLEAQLAQLICGLSTHDLADLSPEQFARIDSLQRRTVQLEREISEEEARVQETVADAEMVELVDAITEAGRTGGDEEGRGRMQPEMEKREVRMERVLEQADRLRLDTLKGLVEILRPEQAVHFLTAAAELHLRVHEFGKSKDPERAGAAEEQ